MDQVVLDDVLELRQGDHVPVDVAVPRAEGLEADEALLTGEAEPVAKQPGERVLSGSFVVARTGRVRAAAAVVAIVPEGLVLRSSWRPPWPAPSCCCSPCCWHGGFLGVGGMRHRGGHRGPYLVDALAWSTRYC